MQSKHLFSVGLAALIVGSISFYGGTLYAKNKGNGARPGRTGNLTGNRPNGFGGGRIFGEGGFNGGEIISKDEKSLTIKLRTGGSKIVLLTPSTQIGKLTAGSPEDLSVGTNVTIIGPANQDGSLTANSIQIRPKPEMPSSQSSDPAAREIVVTSSNFNFDLAEIKVKKGEKLRIKLINKEGFHDWKVDEFNAATTKLQAGESGSVEFTPDQEGSFEYYCSVGSHRQMGMVGKLVVEP